MALLNIIRNHGTIWGSSTEPFWCDVGAVGKTNESHRHVVAGEFIGSRLGALAGLPVAHGAVLPGVDDAPGGLVYISFLAYPEGEPPAPPTSALLASQPDKCAAAVVFDCWIMNSDRHRANVVYAPSVGVPFTLIDFEGCLLANERDVTDPTYLDDPCVGGQLHGFVTSRDHISRWVDQVRSVPEVAVRRVCEEAASLGMVQDWEVERMMRALMYRAGVLPDLLSAAENAGLLTRLGGAPRLPL